jgi:hypothetical protein
MGQEETEAGRIAGLDDQQSCRRSGAAQEAREL